MKKIKTALISVSDKKNLKPVLNVLKKNRVKIISSGGTFKEIKKLKFNCIEVSQFTNSPEILDGRVKTLHPKIHAGILNKRKNKSHLKDLNDNNFENIDLVIVNFYQFENTLRKTKKHTRIVENIDIGGPSMVRAAAKNYNDVTVITSIDQYDELIEELNKHNGSTSLRFRQKLSSIAFTETAYYDSIIANYFNKVTKNYFPRKKIFYGNLIEKLRYGENPHQEGVFYGDIAKLFDQLNGKSLSYNNLLDLDAAINLIEEFSTISFGILKHNNACGFASNKNITTAWEQALAGDPISAFGGVLITNGTINYEVAQKINKLFFEILIAPKFEKKALELLKSKKNRIILRKKNATLEQVSFRTVLNGVLCQEKDYITDNEAIKTVSKLEVSKNQMEDLIFASKICKHTKSNAIVLVKNKQLIGSGCGQTSRVDALQHAIKKAKQFSLDMKNAVMASDAFFPFPDCVKIANKEGIKAVIQPGGSKNDQLSIDYCDKNDIAMIFTKTRHFKH